MLQVTKAKGKRSQSIKSLKRNKTRRIKNSRIPEEIPNVMSKKLPPNKTPINLNADLNVLKTKIKGIKIKRPKKAHRQKNLLSKEFDRPPLKLKRGTETLK
jgi:hypothetical protein